MSPVIAVSRLGFAWPGGDVVFEDLSFTAGAGRTGLIGANGSGKSTLLRLIAGELTPARGSVLVTGSLGYLRQDLALRADMRVDELLGIARARSALRAIDRGTASEQHYADVGDDWDAEERARGTLDRLGLGHIGLDRRVGEVSGGETVLLGVAAQFLRLPDVLLLDEPTNNLDTGGRERLHRAVAGWRGALLVVSHDRALLGLVDQVADLAGGMIRSYGGNLASYEQAVALEQEAAARAVRAAESDLRRQRRELTEARTRLDRRRKYGEKMRDTGRVDKMTAGARQRQAQVTAGKQRTLHGEKVQQAQERLAEAEEAIRDDEEIRVDLPATAVPAGRTVLTVRGARLRGGARADLDVRGPERIALLGPNGAGKTTLLQAIAEMLPPLAGMASAAVPVRFLPQRLDVLDDEDTVVGNAARLAPAAGNNAIRAQLAKFLFRGQRADQIAGTLSGGERFRATLAALLLAEPAPQLLLLDEPTNNLDLASVARLSQALAAYRGALIVASHDLPFLRAAGITRWLRLDGQLAETGPP
jgi:ATPase subunit of ABC transporter with duplicated ATPase domains